MDGKGGENERASNDAANQVAPNTAEAQRMGGASPIRQSLGVECPTPAHVIGQASCPIGKANGCRNGEVAGLRLTESKVARQSGPWSVVVVLS